MKTLICGAGYITGELLKRFGDAWQVTLVEKDETLLSKFTNRHPSIVRVITGDASSPVVLEEAGLADQAYVLALTRDDRVNLAIAGFALEAGIKNVLCLVYLPENLPKFQELGVQTVNVTNSVAGTIYRYLQDPRITVTPVAQGRAELLEIQVDQHLKLLGRAVNKIHHPDWRIVGLMRQNKMMPYDTDTVLQKEDRVLILGHADVFKEVCSLIECGDPHFPRIYGNCQVLGLPAKSLLPVDMLLKEGFHVVKNTKLTEMTVFFETKEAADEARKAQEPQGLTLNIRQADENILSAIREYGREANIGLIVLPLLERAGVDVLSKPVHIALAHTLPCPLLVAKGTHPYERILVPFNGSKLTQSALEVGLDLAIQMGAAVTVIIVQEPEFLHNSDKETDWLEKLLEKVRQLAHIYKAPVEEVVKTGNPVAEVTTLAKDFNLMVIGSTNKGKNFLEPHVGELLVRKSPCSTLILTH